MLQSELRSASRLYAGNWRALISLLVAAALLASCEKGPPTSSPPPAMPEGPSAPRVQKVVYSDITHAYHGLLLDSRLNEIKLDKAVIERLQDSMIQSLTAVPEVDVRQISGGKPASQEMARAPLGRAYVDKVLSGFKFFDDERILTKSALIQKGIDSAPRQEKFEYQWRFNLLHERSLNYLSPKFRELRPEYRRYLRSFADLLELIRRLLEALVSTAYITDCRANSVPIPPDWPSGGWTNRGPLPFQLNFLQSGPDTEVWTYEAPGGEGLCYALPRQTAGSINLLGIICQSKTTGKACFWDNIDAATGARITGVGITLQINRLKDGSNLAENCTTCHRGYNVFLVHPTTPLGAPTSRDPNVRYTPIGQATWSNPPAFASLGSGSCSGCHEIAGLNPSICQFLRQAADNTMPSTAAPAGWAAPSPAYSAHISAMKTAGCPDGGGGGGGATPPPPRRCSSTQQCCGAVLSDGTCDGQCWPKSLSCP